MYNQGALLYRDVCVIFYGFFAFEILKIWPKCPFVRFGDLGRRMFVFDIE